eukprot:TRINITY_DN8381_c0_g4_i3.p1 TRINITY_DN8381_c0_g4~~TRINITY_DN8381_c0_g4_i3.p1  ORF type:complete len:381 (+),score=33.99 TRINITY_DN8381_c0_g4_i3:245-1387(+)
MSQEMVQREDDNHFHQSQEIQVPMQLPGQVCDDQSEEFSTDDEFDLDKFRDATYHVPKKILDQDEQNRQLEQKVHQITARAEYFKYLGIQFSLRKLQQRNKDPKLFLNTILTLHILENFGVILLIVFGSKYIVFSVILHILFQICFQQLLLSFVTNYFVSKKVAQILIFFVGAGFSFGLIIFWFFFDVLFGNIVYFLLSLEFKALFEMLILQLAVLPNSTPFDDQDYQIKFFFSRIIIAILNSTGLLDVLSDIVLGFELIQFKGSLKIMGISLFLLCVMDFLILIIRVMQPKKVTMYIHIWAIVLEVATLSISVLIFFEFNKKECNHIKFGNDEHGDFFGLLVLSFVTTLINFVHHIFVIFEHQVSKQGQKNRDKYFSVV